MRLVSIGENLQPLSFQEMIQDTIACTSFDAMVSEARGRNRVIDPLPSIEEIKRAINNRHYVGFFYNEEEDEDEEIVKSGFRLVEPYVIGKGYKWRGKVYHPDRTYLRAWVVKSSKTDRNKKLGKKVKRRSVSKTNRTPYWRLFRIDRVHSWQEIKLKNPKRRNLYNPDDKMMGEILASAKFK